MSKRRKGTSKPSTEVRRAVDVVDGIPDRSQRRAVWKYVLIVVVFLGWVGFLVYCHLTGNL